MSECLSRDSKFDHTPAGGIFTSIMSDGSKRVSIGAKTRNGLPGSMNHPCGEPAGTLRSLIDTAMRQLFLALDKGSKATSENVSQRHQYLMKPYRTFQELADRGEHLEHLHTYMNTRTNENDKERPTMELHTDAGLLIAMTAGYYTHPRPSSISGGLDGLYVELPSGDLVPVETSASDLIVMVGEGGGRWVSPRQGGVLRAVPHSLILDLGVEPAAARSWYGKMYLPPSDAELHNSRITYGEYRSRELALLTAKEFNGEVRRSNNYIPSVCGEDVTKYILRASTACTTSSGDPGVMCWAQCQSVDILACGQSAVCIDTATGDEVDGDEMCPSSAGMQACELECPSTDSSNSKNSTKGSTNGFCVGTGTSMSMSGFMTTSISTADQAYCFIYLFPSWVLDDTTKFVVACVGTFFLGVAIHSLSKVRAYTSLRLMSSWIRLSINVTAYAVQITLSYLLMLVAMTYSTELFIMVCLGLTAGYTYFNHEALAASAICSPGAIKYGVLTSNPEPCCAHDDQLDGHCSTYQTTLGSSLLSHTDHTDDSKLDAKRHMY